MNEKTRQETKKRERIDIKYFKVVLFMIQKPRRKKHKENTKTRNQKKTLIMTKVRQTEGKKKNKRETK